MKEQIPIQKSFEALCEVIELQKAQRGNAAKSIWMNLNSDFKKRVMRYIIMLDVDITLKQISPTKITSPFGDFTIAVTKVDNQTIVIPDLINTILEVAL